ncbi:hypothetical protein TrST_g12398 [Triparma strigata]|uniref:Uncharacterized protein n=1 Tax=Triparma strigata TaxID=1606541 RepID=A0A9W7E2T4_9STRA|nr:hypothetical protein TrST_g12398 [Triparma strigata]
MDHSDPSSGGRGPAQPLDGEQSSLDPGPVSPAAPNAATALSRRPTSRGRGLNKSILTVQKGLTAGDQYLFNKTTDLHEWGCSTGNILRTIRLAEAEGAKREGLQAVRAEVEADHSKEETKYRSAGRKIREEKAATRFAVMEKLLESQALEYMQMEEAQTRSTSHVDSKYERAIDHLEYTHKLLHDPRFGHAKPIGRILMVKLRRLKQDPKGLLKELASHQHDCCVTEMILRIVEAQLLAAPTDRLALKFVAENFCGALTSVMKIDEWRDNIFLQSVIVSSIYVLGSRCVEARSSFDYYSFVYLTSVLEIFSNDPMLLTSALNAMGILCSQCPLQRKHGFDAGAVVKVVEVINRWRRDWRVVNAGLKALTGLCCRCGSNKTTDEEEGGTMVPLVLDVLQEYSQDNCLETADVCGVVTRSCFLLIKALMSKDDDGVTETFSYEKYLEEGGERIEADPEQDAADDKLKKDKFFAKKEASRKGLDVEDSEEEEVPLKPGEIKMTQLMKVRGIQVMLDCARYHINDPRTVLFFVQCLHSIMYNLLPLIETVEVGGKDTYPEIVDLMLTFMVNFRYNPVLIWPCLTNLTFVCHSDFKSITCIETWGRLAAAPEDEESVDEYAEVSIDDESISGSKVDGCKLLAKGLKDFKNNVDLAE